MKHRRATSWVKKMLFPRAIRLDNTDTLVFDMAAEAGEWAVPGGFVFANSDPHAITGKQRQAFRNGFLGLGTFGWSTLVVVAKIDDREYEAAIDILAAYFVKDFGAPDLDEALPVAREEAAFAAGLCDYPVNTLLALDRNHGEDGLVERFHVIQPAADLQSIKPWGTTGDATRTC